MKRVVLFIALVFPLLAFGQWYGKGYKGGYVQPPAYFGADTPTVENGDMWMMRTHSIPTTPWPADSIAGVAAHDGAIFGQDIVWDSGFQDAAVAIYAQNGGIKFASYRMPSTVPRVTYGHEPQVSEQSALFPFLVGTTRNIADTADCSGGVAAGCDTAAYNKHRYIIDLNLTGAIDSVLVLMERERNRLHTAQPTLPIDILGPYFDIPNASLGPPPGDPPVEGMAGDIDFDNDGIAYDVDTQYYSEVGVACKAAYTRGMRLLFAAMATEFPDAVRVANGIMAVIDSTATKSVTHIITEHTAETTPFYWNNFGDLIAGGMPDDGVFADDDAVDDRIFRSLEAYSNWKTLYGTQPIMFSSKAQDNSGYNHDPIAVLARIYGFASNSINGLGSNDQDTMWPPDRSMYTTLQDLGARQSVTRHGEHVFGTFANGTAHVFVSLAKTDQDDQVDYWAVTTDGATLTSHWHGEDTYTFKFGAHLNLAGSPYDRHLGPDGTAGYTRLVQIDKSSPDAAEGNSYCTILGNEDYGLLSFCGGYGKLPTSMQRVLLDREIKTATLYLYNSYDTRTLMAADSLYVIAADQADLVGWDLPLLDVGGRNRPQPTYNNKHAGEPWDLTGYTYPESLGSEWAAITNKTLTANTYESIDVTDLVKVAADPDSDWAGFWIMYHKGGGGSSAMNFEISRTYLEVEVYAPWAAP